MFTTFITQLRKWHFVKNVMSHVSWTTICCASPLTFSTFCLCLHSASVSGSVAMFYELALPVVWVSWGGAGPELGCGWTRLSSTCWLCTARLDKLEGWTLVSSVKVEVKVRVWCRFKYKSDFNYTFMWAWWLPCVFCIHLERCLCTSSEILYACSHMKAPVGQWHCDPQTATLYFLFLPCLVNTGRLSELWAVSNALWSWSNTLQ